MSLESLIERAQAAASQQDRDEALRAWATVRATYPEHVAGYFGEATALSAARRYDEADDVFRLGTIRFPLDIGLAIHRGWVAMQRGDPEAASRLWEDIRRTFPDALPGYLEGVANFWHRGLLAEADVLATEAIARFPRSPPLRLQYCSIANARTDWVEAARRWAVMREMYPNLAAGYLQGVVALWQLGTMAEADAVLAEGVRRCPAHLEMFRQFAGMAVQGQDWIEALHRWRAFHAKFPGDPQGELSVRHAADQVKQMLGDAAVPVPPRGSEFACSGVEAAVGADGGDDAVSASSAATLLRRFESLGDSCEFGFVQRHYGCEPLSLLRWGFVGLDMALSGLASGFEGIGEPQYTELSINEVGGELLVADSRFFNRMHTHVHHTAVEKAEFLVEMCARLKLLKRKFLEDLCAGEKIFIYRQKNRLSDEEVAWLHEALQTYGTNRLLCVRDPEPARPAGTVEAIGRTLFVGYIDLTRRPLLEPVQHEVWLSVCRQTLAVATAEE